MGRLRVGGRAREGRLAADEPRPRRGAHHARGRRATQAHTAHLGVGRVRCRDRVVPVVAQRGRPRGRRARTASTSSAGSPAAARCSWPRGRSSRYSLYVPASLVAGMTFADSYAFLDDWVLQALRSLGHRRDLPAAQRHRLAEGQDRRRRPEAPRQRRGAAPRDPQLRHGRPGDDRGPAHRSREAQRQGDGVGGQAGRPAAQPDRACRARRSSRASSRRSRSSTAPARAYLRRGICRGGSPRGVEVRHRRVAAPRSVTVEIRHGDNLAVARTLPDGSFTLIYLDPPFNTGRAQTKAVEAREPDGEEAATDARAGQERVPRDELRAAARRPARVRRPVRRLLGLPRAAARAKRGGCSPTTARSTCTSTTARPTTPRCCSTRSSDGSASSTSSSGRTTTARRAAAGGPPSTTRSSCT